jgi:chemotaxis protein MotB
MGQKIRQPEDDEAPGAPEWMVTFSDCMTLLLTFFVLLLSFSSFDERLFKRLTIIFAEAMPGVGEQKRATKEAVAQVKGQDIMLSVELDAGSEKPTLQKGKSDSFLKEEREPVDIYGRKVFSIPSKKIFWGKGPAISSGGRSILATMASFLKEMPSRIVVSENAQGASEINGNQIGLRRAWAVVDYLTEKQGLNKNWFSISAASMTMSGGVGRAGAVYPEGAERTLEVILLERSIYK